MRLHILQHVKNEGLGTIYSWALANNCEISTTKFYQNDLLPGINKFDALVVLGGPMGAYDEALYPWLAQEKRFIQQALQANKPILGICLGSQLLAEVLGSRVYPGEEKEIGWFPVTLQESADKSKIFKSFPKTFSPLHWHGDTFDLPSGATLIASSEAYANQAFQFGNQAVGLQFHLELDKQAVEGFLSAEDEEILKHGRYTQTPNEILSNEVGFKKNATLLEAMLKNLFGNAAL